MRKAAELLGGRDQLAAHLGVKADEIEKWLTSTRPIPRELFLRVVEVILDDDPHSWSDASEPPPDRSAAPTSHW